jgi:hypothetical protein
MSARRKPRAAPDTDALARRFSLGTTQPVEPQPAAGRRTNETPGMTRRTYYYAEDVAEALAEVVDRIYYDSRGRIQKHEVLSEIIRAGLAQADRIEARLTASHE